MEVAGLDCDGTRTCRFGASLVYFCARERRQKLPGHAQTPDFKYAGEFRRVANGRGGRGSRDWWNAHYREIDLRPCTKCGTAHELILLGKSSAPNGRSQVPSVAAKARNRMFCFLFLHAAAAAVDSEDLGSYRAVHGS